ncbi:MAG: GDP-mannose 4,6-dehydratase, partial [Planctomycetales bacterium]
MARRALITGITGQDGAYLANLLLDKGYEVHGIVRRTSHDCIKRIEHLDTRVVFHDADLLDDFSIMRVLKNVAPQEVYNLAAQSFVPASWTQPLSTGDVTALGVTRMLEAIRHVDTEIRFFQASSSEMFGK